MVFVGGMLLGLLLIVIGNAMDKRERRRRQREIEERFAALRWEQWERNQQEQR